MSERIAVGYVARAKGVRGEAKVELLSEDPERFSALPQVFFQREGQPEKALDIQYWRPDGRSVLLKFAGIDSPEEVKRQLVGGYLSVGRDQVPALPEDTYYVFELVGCLVEDESGRPLGRVEEVQSMPSVDVYVVRGGGAELLVPAVARFVREVDIEGRRIVVAGLEELLE